MISWPLDADHVSRSDGGEVMRGRIGENVSVLRGKVFVRLQELNNRGRIVRGWRGNCL